MFVVFKRLFRHLLNWNGLRMFQISGMINLETKFEGSSNRSCAKHYEDQRESRRVCEWQSKLLTWIFPRKHVPMTKKIVKVGHYFFRIRVFFGTFWQVHQFRSFRYGRFVLLFCYANVTFLVVKMKYDRFLQVVAEHVTIIWPVLFWSLDDLFRSKHTTISISRNAFPINRYRIRVKNYKHMRVLKNKREIQNYEKLQIIGLFWYTRVFWCNMRVFPISYKHFTRLGMLQSRYLQCKVEWLLSTWSDYVRYFASSLFAISTS